MPPQIHEGAVISVSFLSFAFVALYDEINSVSFLFPATVALYDRIIIGETPLRPHYMQVLSFCQMEKYYKIRFIALGLGLGHFNLMAYFAWSIAASFSSFGVISIKIGTVLKNIAVVSMIGVSIIALHDKSDFVI